MWSKQDRARRDAESLEAHEREFMERVVRTEREPGDEFFADLAVGTELEAEQRAALTDIRAALARNHPRFVRPSDTSGSLDCLGGYLTLSIRHAEHPEAEIKLVYGDGYLSLAWPWGEAHDRWAWSPLLARVVEALLTGQNRQTVYLLRQQPVAADTWIPAAGASKRLRWRSTSFPAPFPTRVLRRRHVSISFDEPTPVSPLP